MPREPRARRVCVKAAPSDGEGPRAEAAGPRGGAPGPPEPGPGPPRCPGVRGGGRGGPAARSAGPGEPRRDGQQQRECCCPRQCPLRPRGLSSLSTRALRDPFGAGISLQRCHKSRRKSRCRIRHFFVVFCAS